jgi:4-amino-4-deoxy-L-arabinose transferase-like glycosyltransferase
MLAACAVLLVCALYFSGLTGMGLVSKDEPRYADIGRAMARTGDLITPRLWGEPWFEKPPLLYWMEAAGFRAGLGPELAPRLPVALLSVAFLAFFWNRLRRIWDVRVASFATAMLATSAGWVALSGVAVTDIPMAVLFSAAVLLALEDKAGDRHLTWAAASLGLAVLAKSLVPVVLFVPVLALDYRRLREWLRPGPLAAFFGIALPWHVLCYLRNGREFVSILFVQQQFGRFTTTERQHGQPWWFYLPVLLLLLFPWFPLLAGSFRGWKERRIQVPMAVLVFGFLFFSKSLNKLPTYLLPLLPSACILMGVALARTARPERWMVLPVALLGIVPVAGRVIPVAMATGIRSAPISWDDMAIGCAVMALAGSVLAAVLKNRAVAGAVLLTAGSLLWLKAAVLPALDRTASARALWLAERPECIEGTDRGLNYSLQYYAGKELPPCDVLDRGPGRVVR